MPVQALAATGRAVAAEAEASVVARVEMFGE
jgi:hypothetical protein